MGRALLICRLVVRDLRRHPGQAVLLLVAIAAATATLTMGLVLSGTTSNPYLRTRAATAGPDVIVDFGVPLSQAQPAVNELIKAPGVTGYSGPYSVDWVVLRVHGIATNAEAEIRDQAPAAVDQPLVTQGSWVGHGGIVLERSFADALGVRVGDAVTLNGKAFRVAGIAVTAASPVYPEVCAIGCSNQLPLTDGTGLVWLTQAEAAPLNPGSVSVQLNLKLRDPGSAPAFANDYASTSPNPGPAAPQLTQWQGISGDDSTVISDEQQVLSPASWLLALLAVATVAVLADGRMAEQTRRVGLLKAVGSTAGLVAAILLVENLVIVVIAAAAGITVGWLTAPLLANPGAGLIGAPGAPSLTVTTVTLVVVVALVVALIATLVPAVQAARTSTVGALAGVVRAPRRRAGVTAISARLPVPLLLGLRLAARRPRRAILNAASVAVTVTGVVAVLVYHATLDSKPYAVDPVAHRIGQIMLVITVALALLAAVNAVFTSWATVLDARRSSAVARALGATPQQVAVSLSASQVLCALPGALIGIPLGVLLYAAVKQGTALSAPPIWWLVAVVVGALLVMGMLTAIPARIGARRSVAGILQSETG